MLNKFEREDPHCDLDVERWVIYCCGCSRSVSARLVSGEEIYPHRPDLFELPFWVCDTCSNYVGCHYKTADRIRPLGNIPTRELRNARKHIHAILDPLWKEKKVKRGELYSIISKKLGYQYHTAEIRDIEEARKIWKMVRNISKELG